MKHCNSANSQLPFCIHKLNQAECKLWLFKRTTDWRKSWHLLVLSKAQQSRSSGFCQGAFIQRNAWLDLLPCWVSKTQTRLKGKGVVNILHAHSTFSNVNSEEEDFGVYLWWLVNILQKMILKKNFFLTFLQYIVLKTTDLQEMKYVSF